MDLALSFDDVLLEPRYSEITSRKEVSISSYLENSVYYDIPIISSPMDTVTEEKMAMAMYREGGLGIIHRYNSIEEQVKMVRKADENLCIVGAAIGATGDFLERAQALVKKGKAGMLCIDVAHGHHCNVRYALETLRKTFGDSIHIMAGNVATLEGFDSLADWGANSIRVGIGGGSICSTRIQTGHGVPTFQSILDCSRSTRDATLIADGGIRNSGDIVKALAAGADFVMLGSLLAGTDETPGKLKTDDTGKFYKTYRGMASKEAQQDWRGKHSSLEGVSHRVRYKGKIKQVLANLETGIRSGLSYTGAKSIIDLQAKRKFIRQTSSGRVESSTHIHRNGL
tara:strand:+ start:3940 stop:4962 length:1023 start_codon:yes stop_codon:yes gene_type:complete